MYKMTMYKIIMLVCCLSTFPALAQNSAALAQTVNQRLAFMKDVAGYKAAQHLPIEDLVQESTVMSKAKNEATELGLDPASVEPFITAQMDAAKAIQYRYRADWLSQPEKHWQPRPLQEVRLQIAQLSSNILQQLAQQLAIGPIAAEDRDQFVNSISQLNLAEIDKQRLFDTLLLVRTSKP